MSTLFNEAEADMEVAKNIAAYNRQKKLTKELEVMQFYKNEQGEVCKVVSFEKVSKEELVEALKKATATQHKAQKALDDYERLTGELKASEPAPAQPPVVNQPDQTNHQVVQPQTDTPAPTAPAPAPIVLN